MFLGLKSLFKAKEPEPSLLKIYKFGIQRHTPYYAGRENPLFTHRKELEAFLDDFIKTLLPNGQVTFREVDYGHTFEVTVVKEL